MKSLSELTRAEFDSLTEEQVTDHLIEAGYSKEDITAFTSKAIEMIREKEKRPMLPALFASFRNPDVWGVVVLVAIVAALLFGG